MFTRNSEGTSSRSCQKSGEGRWDGGEGQAQKQEVSILRTHTCWVERGCACCSVLTSCITSYSVALLGACAGPRCRVCTLMPANMSPNISFLPLGKRKGAF